MSSGRLHDTHLHATDLGQRTRQCSFHTPTGPVKQDVSSRVCDDVSNELTVI